MLDVSTCNKDGMQVQSAYLVGSTDMLLDYDGLLNGGLHLSVVCGMYVYMYSIHMQSTARLRTQSEHSVLSRHGNLLQIQTYDGLLGSALQALCAHRMFPLCPVRLRTKSADLLMQMTSQGRQCTDLLFACC